MHLTVEGAGRTGTCPGETIFGYSVGSRAASTALMCRHTPQSAETIAAEAGNTWKELRGGRSPAMTTMQPPARGRPGGLSSVWTSRGLRRRPSTATLSGERRSGFGGRAFRRDSAPCAGNLSGLPNADRHRPTDPTGEPSQRPQPTKRHDHHDHDCRTPTCRRRRPGRWPAVDPTVIDTGKRRPVPVTGPSGTSFKYTGAVLGPEPSDDQPSPATEPPTDRKKPGDCPMRPSLTEPTARRSTEHISMLQTGGQRRQATNSSEK